MMKSVLLGAAAVLCCGAAASAQVTILSQTRVLASEVHVEQLFGEPADVTHSFSYTVTDMAAYPVMNNLAMLTFRDLNAFGSVLHTSTIEDGVFAFDSSMSSSYSDRSGVQSGIGGSAEQSVFLQFQVDEPITFSFDATVAHDALNGASMFSLIGENVSFVASSDGQGSVSASGVLQPGIYVLSGSGMFMFEQTNGATNGGPYTSSFLASFTYAPIPAPGAAAVFGLLAGVAIRRRR